MGRCPCSIALCPMSRQSPACSASLIRCASSRARSSGLIRTPHEPPRWMRFPIELLVFVCVAVGMFPAQTIGPFLDVAVRSVLGPDTPQYSLAVWHGFNQPLLMSFLALAGGAVLYLLL